MDSKQLKILAIDHNQDNLIAIKALISEAFNDAFIFTALTGKKGLELAAIEDPDVILLDIVMPDMDGFEVCEKLKADKNLSDIPVVFVTAIKGDQESRIRGLDVGGEAFLSKPIDETELTAQIRAMAKIKAANVRRHSEKERLSALVIEKTRELKENHVATLNLLDDLKNENEARRKSEEALKINEERFRNISASISDMSYSCNIDVNGNSTLDWMYGASERITGYTNEEMIALKCWGKLVVDEDFSVFKKHILDVKPGFSDTCQLRIRNANGDIVWIQASSKCVKQKDSEKVFLFGGIIDITERMHSEEALRENEKKYRLITEKISDVVWLMDLNGKSLFVSKSVEDFSGFTVEEYLNQTIYDRFTPDSLKIALEALNYEVAYFNEIKLHPTDYRKMLLLDYICKDGSIKTGEVLFSPYLDENDKLIAIHGVTRDFTERKKADKALRESEEKFREMTDLLPQIVYETDHQGNLTYLNKQAYSICGYSVDDVMIGVNMINFFIPDDKPRVINNFRLRELGKSLNDKEFTLLRKDGSTFPAMVYSSPIIKDNESLGLRGIIIDISERKQAEYKIQHLTRLYALLSQINEAIVRIHNEEELFQTICRVAVESGQFRMAWIGATDEADNRIKPITHAGYEDGYLDHILITTGEEVTAQGLSGMAFRGGDIQFSNNIATDPKMLPWREEALKRGYRSSAVVPFMRRGNSYGVLNLYSTELEFFSEEQQRLLHEIGGDITFALDSIDSETDRKQVVDALERSRAELKTIYDNAPVIMCVVNEERGILFANNAFKEFTNSSNEDVLYQLALGEEIGCVHSLDDPRGCGFSDHCNQCSLKLAMKDTFKTGIGHRSIEYSSTILRNDEEHEVVLLGSTALIQTDGHDNLLLCLIDITERKHTEEALQKSERFLRTFIENMPFEMWARDVDSIGILENSKHVDHFGSILGKTPQSFVELDPNVKKLWESNNKRVFDGELINEEIEYVTDNQLNIFQEINFPIYHNEKMIGIAGFNINITERKRIEEALKESQSLYYSFIEQLPNPVFRKDSDGHFIFANSQFYKLKGLTKEDCIGKKPTEILNRKYASEDEKKRLVEYEHLGEELFEIIKQTGKTFEAEEEYGTEDGGKKYMHIIRMPVLDSYGAIIGSQGIMFDITERKQVEKALNISQEKLKQFAAHLQNVREEERTELAREIHDDLGQILIALKIDLGLMKQKLFKVIDGSLFEAVSANFDNLFGLVDNTIKTTRRIMTGLRPEVLELLGFIEATKLYTNDFQERYKLSCSFDCFISKLDINLQQSVALYRILQEALSNVVRHAKASEVKVQIDMQTDKLIMEIVDNGVGFDEFHKGRTDSYGMIGMKERAFLLDGELSITSKPGQGTTVRVEMPYFNN